MSENEPTLLVMIKAQLAQIYVIWTKHKDFNHRVVSGLHNRPFNFIFSFVFLISQKNYILMKFKMMIIA